LCLIPCQSHPPWHYSNYTWKRVTFMKLIIMQYPSTSNSCLQRCNNSGRVYLCYMWTLLYIFLGWRGVRVSPLGTSVINWHIIPAAVDRYDEFGAVGGIRIGRGNGSTRRKPAPVSLCPP
jgi:hypothetical protein